MMSYQSIFLGPILQAITHEDYFRKLPFSWATSLEVTMLWSIEFLDSYFFLTMWEPKVYKQRLKKLIAFNSMEDEWPNISRFESRFD